MIQLTCQAQLVQNITGQLRAASGLDTALIAIPTGAEHGTGSLHTCAYAWMVFPSLHSPSAAPDTWWH
jgi:hypothetical protein